MNEPNEQGIVGYYAQIVNQIGFPVAMAGILLYLMLKFIPAITGLATAVNNLSVISAATASKAGNEHKQMLDLLWQQQRELDWLMNAKPSPLATPTP